ncbi:MAG: hypothetical protein DCF12_14465 [Snowella sp.]|nr:MAG: hypothetical protein DCF12_14465 [Snowella sp.]
MLRFDEKIVNLYIRLCVEEELGLSYDNLLYSFLSFSWKHSFLDIYRCIERLFFIPRTEVFYNAICSKKINYSQISFIDFSKKLEESTGWKPNEQDSLEQLLEVIEDGNLELFNKLQKIANFPYQESDKNNKITKITAKFIYTLRNNIVHFRPINEEKNYNDEEWNIIIEFCLEVVIDLYKKYKKYL